MNNSRYKNTGPEIEFEIVKENWNHYVFTDGSKLRARILLTRVFQDKNDSNLYLFEFSPPILVVSCPDNMKGEKNNEPKPQEYEGIPTVQVEIQGNPEEYWNDYSLKDSAQAIKIKYTIAGIKKAKNRFDQNGCPFYFITGTPAVSLS